MTQRRLSFSVLIADLAWCVVAMGSALVLRYGVHWSALDRDSVLRLLPFFGVAGLLWILFSGLLPLDGFRGGWRLSAVVSQLLLAVGMLMLILLSGGYILRSYVSRLALVELSLLLFSGCRKLFDSIQGQYLRNFRFPFFGYFRLKFAPKPGLK